MQKTRQYQNSGKARLFANSDDTMHPGREPQYICTTPNHCSLPVDLLSNYLIPSREPSNNAPSCSLATPIQFLPSPPSCPNSPQMPLLLIIIFNRRLQRTKHQSDYREHDNHRRRHQRHLIRSKNPSHTLRTITHRLDYSLTNPLQRNRHSSLRRRGQVMSIWPLTVNLRRIDWMNPRIEFFTLCSARKVCIPPRA